MKIDGIAIDCEFTSFDMIGGDLLSIGATEVMEDLTIGRSIELFFKPRSTKYFTEKAEEVHGISYWKAQQFPEARQSCIEFLHWLKPLEDQFPLKTIYHGSWAFDKKWIAITYEKNDLTPSYHKAFHYGSEANVLKMARKNLKQLKKHSLDLVADHYGLEHRHHSALSDSMVTAQAYINLTKNIDTFTGELF